MGRRVSLTIIAWLGLALLGAAAAHAQAKVDAPPATSGISAAAFPTADEVTRQFKTDPERLAALAVLLDLLMFKMDDTSPAALERQTDYRRTITRLDPPRATDDQRAVARTLRRDVSFQNAVVTEFLPAYAPQAARAAALARTTPSDAAVATLWTALVAAVCAALLVPVVLVVRRRR
jgi:hypothetical protein